MKMQRALVAEVYNSDMDFKDIYQLIHFVGCLNDTVKKTVRPVQIPLGQWLQDKMQEKITEKQAIDLLRRYASDEHAYKKVMEHSVRVKKI